eukprot:CAMPEP_0182928470 /NCGR_PEP_ID=MMETSP0105_2-20130417/15605_1 /TAXON_ID=81532 ORGANISM="Acanthoeca-like sp., Strain 10tr" /NCGR_SAMPLE_ID=MMETSP0105_2 /ASSEMBLY_ACC=CAM_ASM_000205 /LENGTH=33 /DNA_ID= /DNA_START= /DNA_END= /DNA_ORIENTATION=
MSSSSSPTGLARPPGAGSAMSARMMLRRFTDTA